MRLIEGSTNADVSDLHCILHTLIHRVKMSSTKCELRLEIKGKFILIQSLCRKHFDLGTLLFY